MKKSKLGYYLKNSEKKNIVRYFGYNTNTGDIKYCNKEKAKKLNKMGYNIYYPKNVFQNSHSKDNLIKIKSFGWDFDFISKEQKDKINGDLSSPKFWEEYLDRKEIKDIFSKAFNRKQEWQQYIRIVNTYKGFHLSIFLRDKVKYLKPEFYKKFHKHIEKNLILPFEVSNTKDNRILIGPDPKHKGLIGLLKVPGFLDGKKGRDNFLIEIVKKETNKIAYFSFKKMLSKGKNSIVSSNLKHLTNADLFNKHKNKKKESPYKKSLNTFWAEYKEKNQQGNIQTGKNRFIEGTNKFYKKYGFKNIKLIPHPYKKNKISIKQNDNIINFDGLVFSETTISDFTFFDNNKNNGSEKGMTDPFRLFRKRVLSHHIKGYNKKINNLSDIKFFNDWLSNAMSVKWGEDNNELSKVPYQIAKDTHEEPTLIKKILKEKGVSTKKHITSTWIDFFKLTGGSYQIQKQRFKEKGIKPKAMNGWIIAPFDEISKLLGKTNYNSQNKLKETFKQCGTLFKEKQYSKNEFEIEQIKLLDYIAVRQRKKLLPMLDKRNIDHPIKKEWISDERYNRKFVVLKISEEYKNNSNSDFFAQTMSIPRKLYNQSSKKDISFYLMIKFGLIGRTNKRNNNTKVSREKIKEKLNINNDTTLSMLLKRLTEKNLIKYNSLNDGYFKVVLK